MMQASDPGAQRGNNRRPRSIDGRRVPTPGSGQRTPAGSSPAATARGADPPQPEPATCASASLSRGRPGENLEVTVSVPMSNTEPSSAGDGNVTDVVAAQAELGSFAGGGEILRQGWSTCSADVRGLLATPATRRGLRRACPSRRPGRRTPWRLPGSPLPGSLTSRLYCCSCIRSSVSSRRRRSCSCSRPSSPPGLVPATSSTFSSHFRSASSPSKSAACSHCASLRRMRLMSAGVPCCS